MADSRIDFLYLSEEDMLKAGVNDVVACTECMEELLITMDKGDYLMGGENGNWCIVRKDADLRDAARTEPPTELWLLFRITRRSPICRRTDPIEGLWRCRLTLAVRPIWQV